MALRRYQVHQKVNSYVFTKIVDLEELKSTLYELTHEPSGASIMHIANDDSENLFCLGFKTLPSSSNGVAHILEHTVLCGSKKYPIKDPFFAMTRRSLNTFMNALTGSDFTCYPAASQVEKDFYNLLDVYLDAVFAPLLNPLSFKQEGHRLEFEKPKSFLQSPLIYKGIVYNEMKGAMSSSDSRLWHALLKHLVPDLPYSFNSGGDPDVIPSLTYEEFTQFYRTYYHPSRCLFFFYGDIPLEKHLAFLDDTLKNVQKTDQLPPIPKQKRFERPKSFVVSYPVQGKDLSHKTMIAFAWLTTSIENQQDLLALQLLDSILMDTDASILKYPLLKSKLCRQADSFIDPEMTELPFAIVCKGTEEKHLDALEKLIFKNLEVIAQNGIDEKLILSSIHQLELSRTEINGDDSPFGLTLFFRSALAKMHNSPTENSLVIHELFTKLLKLTENKDYLPSIIRKYFLQNPHYIKLVMKPDPTLASKEENKEKQTLEILRKSLSQKDLEKILKEQEELQSFQKTLEGQAVDCLPKITLNDVPKEAKSFKLDTSKYKDHRIFVHDCFTNHLVYPTLILDLPKLSEEEHLYARLFSAIVTELGSADRSYENNLALMHAHTGGIGCSLSIHAQYHSPNELKPAISLRGKALSRHTNHLFLLMRDFLFKPRFDEKERIKELILQIYTHMQNRINKNALSYAIDLAMSSFTYGGYLQNLWHGIPYFQFIEKIAKNLDQELPNIIDHFNRLKDRLFHSSNMDLVISAQKEEFQVIHDHHFYGLLDKKPHEYHAFSPPKLELEKAESQARIISSPVAFTAMGCKLKAAPHPDAAALSLACSIMDHTVLHKKIREQGGAYGSGAFYTTTTGNFVFYSYRDPHIKATIETFTQAPMELLNSYLNERQLEEAKISMIQHLDSPVSPSLRAMTTYSQYRENKTQETRQAFREAILNTTLKQISHAIENQLKDFHKIAEVYTFSGKELIDKENQKLPNKLPIYTI